MNIGMKSFALSFRNLPRGIYVTGKESDCQSDRRCCIDSAVLGIAVGDTDGSPPLKKGEPIHLKKGIYKIYVE